MPLLGLPEDVLSIILSFTQPQDYLSFCQVNRQVYSEYRQDSVYWRTNTAETFRLPISPLLAADGPRWYWLYKRLKTQTQLYTWGQGLKGNLGPGRAVSVPRRPYPQIPHRGPLPRVPARITPRVPISQIFQRVSSTWPTETHVPDEVGVIADLQCGGWSTTILSSSGKLYTVGSIDSLNGIPGSRSTEQFRQLEYLTQSNTAVRQFSAGRRHILALTDDGEIISWDRINRKGLKVFSRDGHTFGGTPSRVTAGWGESSAYVPSVGIVYWSPVENNLNDDMLDGVHVKEKVIPGTARINTEAASGGVLKHVVLEDFIVWITNESKLYAFCLSDQDALQTSPSHSPFEVPGYAADGRELKDIQGQFQRFGVFTAAGEVLAGDVSYLKRCAEAVRNDPQLIETGDWSALTDLLAARPQDVPALQHTNVIGLAYGDYHYHALHADGKITSYGRDSQSCGALGLSGLTAGGRFRGLRRAGLGMRADADLLPIANVRGRQIWFEPERKDWLQWLEDELDQDNMRVDGNRARSLWEQDTAKAAAFSEWIEQEGRHWDEGPVSSTSSSPGTENPKQESAGDYANLGAYFAIGIAAAGWHSGALVLKDEEKAHEIRSKWVAHREPDEHGIPAMPGAFEQLDLDEVYLWKKEGFPKVSLPDGYEMPGVGEPRPWRDGMPTMHELGLEDT